MLTNLCRESFFNLEKFKDGRSRDSSNLPSLGLISVVEDQPHFMVQQQNSFVPLSSLLDFVICAKKTHSQLNLDNLTNFFKSADVEKYLNLAAENNENSRSNWFCRPEINFLHQLIVFFDLANQGSNDLIVRSAMTLMTHYQLSDSIRANWLMNHIIFNQKFIGDSLLSTILANVNLTKDKFSSNVNLENLKETYQKVIFKDEKELEQTKILWEKLVYSLPSCVLNNHGETLLPGDWQYLPLLILLNQHKEKSSQVDLDSVKSCLCWVRIMNFCNGVKNGAFCYSRLATIFLAASDLFLDPEVKNLVKICLQDILKKPLIFA